MQRCHKVGYTLIGHHEIMVPLLAQAVVDGRFGPLREFADFSSDLASSRQARGRGNDR